MAVALVFVSHSAKLAEGLRDLAQEMASEVDIRAAGGTADGCIGTSIDVIEAAITQLRRAGREVVILTDLGSATMTVEMLLECYEDEPVRFVDAPLVEGAIAAAVAAQQGVDLPGVVAAARNAMYDVRPPRDDATSTTTAPADTHTPRHAAAETEPTPGYSRTATVADEAGLHARPAALIAEMAAEAEGEVELDGADAASALMVMGLGLGKGETVTITGEKADAAVIDRIADAITTGVD
ncbi:PTS-dependent dihydroxyacetone kinase, phosphotransferase subunit DhaM [Corynebacterium ciconiae DSM 44920]|uniref:dihydroxyacetone kinase phosphoryl donor subunit DhaM n=1 Tax=Corynebacterium ciconiae TaxID=227319 RepID=UPI000363EE31|nr:dihydroxyacetone kinase phosphoryl donor subunit DhaM [Corynebacterium ciconiae]WKD62264.1 PTS-dependent dihydroxyacetone kinase, phosphotransferase subunit DhaM [Corynebacterium ciconiae DSM 44920]